MVGKKYEINTSNRIIHFLAQSDVESMSGFSCVERFGGEEKDIRDYFKKYEEGKNREAFGNYEYGDGAKYRGAGALQMTGKNAYIAFSEYMGDDKILSDGALYVGQNYFWESAGFYWSIYKPGTAGDDRYNFNRKCDANESVETISRIINYDMDDDDVKAREEAYSKYIKMFE